MARLGLCALVLAGAWVGDAEDGTGTCPSGDKRCGAAFSRSLTRDTVPQKVLDAQYAVRGEIVTRSSAIRRMLQEGNHSLPFDEVVSCNIGNPQELGMRPVTFHRQVLSILSNPNLLEDPLLPQLYPSDVIARAREYLQGFSKMGAYSHSKGVELFRKKVAAYIDRRDGPLVPTDIEDLFLTDGASSAAKTVLEAMIDGPLDGLLVPVPQYPLYSAIMTRLGGASIGYTMVEDYKTGNGWGIDVDHIEAKIKEFLAIGGRVRGIVVINPGNPIGNVMSLAEVQAVVKLCEKYSIVILADEVYQDNIWRSDKEFVPFRKVILETQSPVELMSFHSISKGYYGECGLRAGYVHMTNIDGGAMDQIYKLFSMVLCANTLGQAMMASLLNPPVLGDPSYVLFQQEKSHILDDLKRKADLVHRELDAIEGIQCLPVEGALYAFPQVDLPPRFVDEAQKLGKAPDLLYCTRMLEATGVVTVPGSGFGQRAGTWHYRMTTLPDERKLREVLGRMRRFHEDLLYKYLAPGERAAEDRTPTPCLPSYDEAFQIQVIEKHLGRAPQGQERPQMLLLLGGSGAGKGIFLRAMRKSGFPVSDFVEHGLDEYVEHLPEYQASVGSRRVVYRDAADGCYGGVVPIAKAASVELIARRQHVAYEDTGKDLERILKRVLPPFQEAGYRISVVLIDNTPEVAKRRAHGRFMQSGRYSSDSYIDSTFVNVAANYATLRDMPQVKESVYCDNSCLSSSAGESKEDGGCLKCWLDKGPAELFPASALLSGLPVRLAEVVA